MATSVSPSLRKTLVKIFDSSIMHVLIASLIILSLVTLGLETSPEMMDNYGHILHTLNLIILAIFVVEITGRILAHGIDFFSDPWHVFDFLIVLVAVLTIGGFFQILRALRLFWFMRLISSIPQFRHLVDAVVRAIPKLLAVVALLFVTIYVFGVIGTLEFSHTTPKFFGSIYTTMGSLSEAMLMPSIWPKMLKALNVNHPLAWVYMTPAVVIINYLLLHLVLGIILSAINQQHEKDMNKAKGHILEKVKQGSIKAKDHEDISTETRVILHHLDELKKAAKKAKK